jgi:two-component system, NtrC family, response regulator AtoC
VSEKTTEILRLLVVSRESAVLRPLWSVGESNAWQIESVTNGWGAMERVQSGVSPDLLILDLPRADTDALHFLRWLRRLRPELPIIVICDRNDSPTKQEALRLGARDCVLKPVEDQGLERAIRAYLSTAGDIVEVDITSEDVEQVGDDLFFVGASPIMRKLRAQAELLAEIDAPVLICGESGSGKETAARLIHQLSFRSGFGFAKINCAALPSDLLETELFGCERNGTGLPQSKPGKLELCEKGTILLDEITEMPMTLQAKLLQVLQARQFARPGSGALVGVDVRILTASATNVEPAISENKLREDLYHHLSAYTICVPAVRERREEIPLLMHHFMRHLANQYALSPRTFSLPVLEACQGYSWPGNLRELEAFVKRYLLLAGGKDLTFAGEVEPVCTIEKDTLVLSRTASQAASPAIRPDFGISGSDSLKSLVQTVKLETEKNAIAAALERTGWNRKAAARLLRVSYRTLLYKIEQYQMRSPDSSLISGGTGIRSNGNGFGGNGYS